MYVYICIWIYKYSYIYTYTYLYTHTLSTPFQPSCPPALFWEWHCWQLPVLALPLHIPVAAEAFSKVRSISISHSKFSSELTFENVLLLHFRCIFMLLRRHSQKSALSVFHIANLIVSCILRMSYFCSSVAYSYCCGSILKSQLYKCFA